MAVPDPMDIGLFLRGLIVGFSVAAPVGPIGLLCIRRTLAEGRALGMAAGLGAATADAFYGAVAAFGLTAVSGPLLAHATAIRLAGGVALCLVGTRIVFGHPAADAAPARGSGLGGAFAWTFLLTLASPATILAFVAIFAGLGLVEAVGDWARAGTMVLGVFAGSAVWWLLLSAGIGRLRAFITPAALTWLNRIAGAALIGFGVAALLSRI